MHRATISIAEDSEDEKVAFEAWCERWRPKMAVFSDDYGCGCCVHLYDVEGPQEAIQALPAELVTMSDWTENQNQKNEK